MLRPFAAAASAAGGCRPRGRQRQRGKLEEAVSMPRNVRGALLQATWTGDKESMIQKHEGYAHEAAKQGSQIMLFQELFYGPYFCQVQEQAVLQLHRAHPGRPDDQAHAGPRQADGHGPRDPDVRGGLHLRHLLQHRRGDRRGRQLPGQVPQDAHPARPGVLGEVLLPPRQPRATRCSRPRSARSASTSATTATSRRVRARWASTAPRS